MVVPVSEGRAGSLPLAMTEEVELILLEAQVGAECVADLAAGELLRAAQTVERHLPHGFTCDQCVTRVLGYSAGPVLHGGRVAEPGVVLLPSG